MHINGTVKLTVNGQAPPPMRRRLNPVWCQKAAEAL
jgi:hypothetical protein